MLRLLGEWDPIVYADQLTCFVSVWGKMAAISRLKGIEGQPVAALIYEGDEVEIGFTDEGEMEVKSHKTSWANVQNGKITGAYASVIYKGQKRTAVLPMKEILEGWQKSQADKMHTSFTGEFAKRSALNRLAKVIVKSSTDNDILAETIEENEERNFDFSGDVVETVKKDAAAKTGATPIPEPKPTTPPVTNPKAEAPKTAAPKSDLPFPEAEKKPVVTDEQAASLFDAEDNAIPF